MNNIVVFLVLQEPDTKKREDLNKKVTYIYNKFIHINAVDDRKISNQEYCDKTIYYFVNDDKKPKYNNEDLEYEDEKIIVLKTTYILIT